MKAPFVVHCSVGEGEQGEEVAEEADSDDDGQVEVEEQLVLPGGLGHTVLLLPGGVSWGFEGRPLERVFLQSWAGQAAQPFKYYEYNVLERTNGSDI